MTVRRRLIGPAAALGAVTLLLAASAASGSSPGLPAALGATGGSGDAGLAVPLEASLQACHTDAAQAGRYAIFASQTTAAAVRGTVLMSVEFVLEERSAGSGFAVVPAPGFGTWVTSQRGVGIFSDSHEVTGLPAPAAFRVLVRARWIGRGHRILRRAEALSPVCAQPLGEPDLAIGAVYRSGPQTPSTVTWNVAVRNLGSAPAGQFEVSLSVDGTALAPVTVPGLAPAASQVVQIAGPRCGAGGTLVATADPTNAIVEPADSRRTRTIACS